MRLGIIGLGTMGANMAERLVAGGHAVVGYDTKPSAVRGASERGAEGVDSLHRLVECLSTPRAVWMMVPAGAAVDQTIEALVPMLEPGDVLIDGGNSNYKHTLRRAREAHERKLHFVDVGTSGGVWGRTEGYSLMVGGDPQAVERIKPILETLAPARDKGWGRVGPSGAGHFVKMIHNGIEYGLMQAYAEGFAILERKRDLELDLHQVAEIWRFGSVIRSWLLDLTARTLGEDVTLSGIAPYVPDSGEGRWTVSESIDLNIPAPVITLALQQRLRSRIEGSFADKLLAAMRREFGGHSVKRSDE